jgi:hypothetical protein
MRLTGDSRGSIDRSWCCHLWRCWPSVNAQTDEKVSSVRVRWSLRRPPVTRKRRRDQHLEVAYPALDLSAGFPAGFSLSLVRRLFLPVRLT